MLTDVQYAQINKYLAVKYNLTEELVSIVRSLQGRGIERVALVELAVDKISHKSVQMQSYYRKEKAGNKLTGKQTREREVLQKKLDRWNNILLFLEDANEEMYTNVTASNEFVLSLIA